MQPHLTTKTQLRRSNWCAVGDFGGGSCCHLGEEVGVVVPVVPDGAGCVAPEVGNEFLAKMTVLGEIAKILSRNSFLFAVARLLGDVVGHAVGAAAFL